MVLSSWFGKLKGQSLHAVAESLKARRLASTLGRRRGSFIAQRLVSLCCLYDSPRND